MEEVCTCGDCGNQTWKIYHDRMECARCGKTYTWPTQGYIELLLLAQNLIKLTNGNG